MFSFIFWVLDSSTFTGWVMLGGILENIWSAMLCKSLKTMRRGTGPQSCNNIPWRFHLCCTRGLGNPNIKSVWSPLPEIKNGNGKHSWCWDVGDALDPVVVVGSLTRKNIFAQHVGLEVFLGFQNGDCARRGLWLKWLSGDSGRDGREKSVENRDEILGGWKWGHGCTQMICKTVPGAAHDLKVVFGGVDYWKRGNTSVGHFYTVRSAKVTVVSHMTMMIYLERISPQAKTRKNVR